MTEGPPEEAREEGDADDSDRPDADPDDEFGTPRPDATNDPDDGLRAGEDDTSDVGERPSTEATEARSPADRQDGSRADGSDDGGDRSDSAESSTDDVERPGSADASTDDVESVIRHVGDEDAPAGDPADEVGAGADAAHESGAGADAADEAGAGSDADEPAPGVDEDVPPDVRKYDRFKKIEGGTYDRANEFLRERTYITAREWAIARLCADFRTETGVEMTKIGENLPELVPFMTDTYTPQAVNQARAAFEEKVRKAGATFLYGAMCDFFTAEELDDVMYEATEVAKFLLEVEGVELTVADELDTEDRISEVMREVREQSAALRHDEVRCPECGHHVDVEEETAGD